ncbi:extracellular solute-binding protein [Litorilinea aerophila]|uniref:Extracellular solute-binding protein n=1 Tax=Litorilinea aerophila TaxID=1204385 RepID=A0A540VF02_9CHLR|nr:extracellular solute-binding protein [Litorilinea aerophila]MCC9076861.1 extracellular solute-binding protein [Litorilinea aerophila]
MSTPNAKLSRRRFMQMAGMVAGGTVLAACAPSAPAPAAGGEEGGAPAAEAINLTFWGFATNRNKWYQALAERYKEEHPEVSIDIQEIAYEEMHNKVATTLVAGTGAPDIADIEISRFGQYVKGERVGFVALNDQIAEIEDNLYLRSALSPWSWQGKYYGIGNELNACLLFYRHDLLEAAGIEYPFDTWEGLTQAGQQYVEATGKKFVSLAIDSWDYWWIIAQAFNGFFDSDGNPSFDNEGGVRVMQMLANWRWEDEIAVQRAQDQAFYGQMMADEFAIHMGAPWMQGFMKDNAAELEGKWEMQLLPLFEDGSGARSGTHGGTGTCITEQSQHPDVAWDFIRFCNLTNDGVLLGFEMQNLFPTWKPAWEDERLQFQDPYFNNQRPADFITEAAPHMPPLNNSPWWPEVTDAFERLVITPVLSEETKMPVEEAMANCRAEVDKLIGA